MNYRITFVTPILGTAPLDEEIYANYILDSQAVNGGADELASIREDKGKTGFHRNEAGQPILYDYVLKGFFKDACGMLSRVEGSESKKLKAYKKIIDGLIFVFPRQIVIQNAGDISTLQRPLRAQTAQGERVALAHSERIEAGAYIDLEIEVLDSKVVSPELLAEWFNYGRLRGLGQWRNGSWGRFSWAKASPAMHCGGKA